MGAGGKEVGRISIRVVPDLDDFRSKIVAACEEIEKAVKVKIDIVPDMDGFREKVRAATEKLPTAKVKVKTEVEQSDFAKLMAEAKAAAKAAGVKLDIDFRDSEAEAKLAGIIAKLKAEAAASNIKLKVDVDTDRLGKAMSGIGSGASSAALSLPNMSHGLLIAAAVAAFAAPALALLSGALLVLPTLITAVIAPIGALALGMDGIKKAAEAAGLLSEGKKGKTTLGAQLKDLQSGVSGVFQAGLTPVFMQLTTLLPAVKSGMMSVAGGLVTVAQGFTNVITSQKGMDQIKSIFTNIGSAISASAPGFANFTSGMLTLIDKVSAKLPSLSKMFNGWGESFSKWINKITLPDWITGKSKLDKGLSTFKDTLKTVLDLVGDLAKKGFEWLSDPKFGDKMKDFVNSMKTLVNDVLPAFAAAFSGVADLVKGIKDISEIKPPEWMRGNADKGKDGKPNGGPPSPKDTGDSPDNILDGLFLASPLSILGLKFKDQLINALRGADFSSVWETLTSSAQTAWDGVKVIASTAIQSLSLAGAGWDAMWSGLTTAAQTAWTNVTAIVGAAVGQVGAVVAQVPATLANVWNSLPAAASGAWNAVVSIVQAAVSSFVSTVNSGVQQVLAFFQALPGQIVGALANLGAQLFSAGANAVGQLVKGIMSVDVKGAVASVLGGIGALIPHSPAKEGPFSGSGWTSLFSGGQSIGDQFAAGLEGGFEGVLGRAKALMQTLSDALSKGVVPDGLKGQIKDQMAQIGAEYDQLKLQMDQTTDKGEKARLRDQMKQLTAAKDQLRVDSDQAGFSNRMGNDKNDPMQQMGQQVNKMVDIAKGFGQANLKQFENDIGISGHGAISTIADTGIGWATGMLSKLISGGGMGGTTIHVGSVDEAMTIKQREANKAALQWKDR